jgi:O-antigen/teichoic acid export membrane protein
MHKPETSLKKRYLFKLMTNCVGLGIGLITQSIVPRALGPSSYGNFSFLTNFFLQLSSFLSLNSSTAFYTKLSQRQHDKGLISFYFYLTLLVGILMGVLVGAAYLLGIARLVWPEQKTLFVVMAAIWVFFQVYSVTFIQISDAYGLTTKSEVVNMIQKVLGLLIIVFLFWADILNLFNYFIFQLIMFIIVNAALYVLIQKYKNSLLSHWCLNKDQLKAYIKEFSTFCLPLAIFYFFSISEQILDRWFLQKFSGSTQQGFYSLAYQTGTICFLFVSALIPLIMREYAILFAKSDIENMRQLFSKYSKMLFAIAAFFGCFLAAEAKSVMLIFGGQAYIGAVIPITIMCFYPIHQTYGQMNGAFFLPPLELEPIAISVSV